MDQAVHFHDVIPDVFSQQGASIFGYNDETSESASPGDSRRVEVGAEVEEEVLFDDGPLVLGASCGRGEEVLGVILVYDVLESSRQNGGKEDGHHDKIAIVSGDIVAQVVKRPAQEIVELLEDRGHDGVAVRVMMEAVVRAAATTTFVRR